MHHSFLAELAMKESEERFEGWRRLLLLYKKITCSISTYSILIPIMGMMASQILA